jgi:galactokinase
MDPCIKLRAQHRKSFPGDADIRCFSCPGRINLIGEHIDYNGGDGFSAAIDKRIYAAISKNKLGLIRFNDLHFNARKEFRPGDIRPGADIEKVWLYPYGAISLLELKGAQGYDMSFDNSIPSGAGVSSSAAITIITLFAVSTLAGITIESHELARLGQRVEQEFAGVSCGIMDQFAVIHGRKDAAMLLDTRDLSFEYVGIDSHKVHFILVNSGVKHSLRDSAYNDRRRECEEALHLLKKAGIKIEHLCDLDSASVDMLGNHLTGNALKRALHSVTENDRSINYYRALTNQDYKAAGKLMYDSHRSLKDDFEVSIPEIDSMVEWTQKIAGVYGARMMGGGFGGCTLNMVARDRVRGFVSEIGKRFESEFGKKAEIFDCVIDDGVKELSTL